MIYATNPEWLGTLYPPEDGSVYLMSEDGVRHCLALGQKP